MMFNNKIKELRKGADMSQQELADKLHIHVTHLSKMENGHLMPSIDNFGNKLTQNGKSFLYSIEVTVSDVIKIEVLGWLNTTEQQLKPLYAFMEAITVLPINDAIIEKTIAIRQHKKIVLGDDIIATTALVHNLSIILRNSADFKNVEGLQVVNPYKLYPCQKQS